ncbi:D-beta-hydroxybutyrate dehydrogenase, mitochondrial [Fragariocoptes setiger]|uniref:D-beta-hydroxybutyrate dehydrogenase, mitochondrial n=1 Tax=Fragariocoptes setiger TaxID=1670756 RepID=A0ABQ7S935_9ACAR|nr:D-beta-hydroxybutyrate dehydrogenase, mitochondrial [Fragariocoptes setiger]
MFVFNHLLCFTDYPLKCLCCIASTIALLVVIRRCCFQKSIEVSPKKAIVITGCDSGIGLEIAKHYIKLGFTVVCGLLDCNNSAGSKELSELVRTSCISDNNRAHLIKLDITKSEDIDNLLQLLNNLNKIDIKVWALVNNAGICVYGELDWLTPEHCDQQILVNTLGTIKVTRALLPFIITAKALRLGDFARLTKIMAKHGDNVIEMRANLNESKRKLYGHYFDAFHNFVLQHFGMVSPPSYEESTLFRDFDRAVLSHSPPPTIVCDTIGFRIYYFIVETVPINVQYIFLDLILKYLFKWTSPGCGDKKT